AVLPWRTTEVTEYHAPRTQFGQIRASAGLLGPARDRTQIARFGVPSGHRLQQPGSRDNGGKGDSCSRSSVRNLAASARVVDSTRPDRTFRGKLLSWALRLSEYPRRRLWAAVGADDQLWVVRVYRRTGISVDRLAVHPLDEVAGRERPHARGVPGEVGVVEEV